MRAAYKLSRAGGALPAELRSILPFLARIFLPKKQRKKSASPLASAIARLGPSYIKIGQLLAVRPDIIGMEYARDLSHLHDKVPPFAQEQAEDEIKRGFGVSAQELFAAFGPAVAAASIAQVHKARSHDGKDVAVKILRPGIEKKFRQDMTSFFWAAEKIEQLRPEIKRLRPMAALENLQETALREMDLRMEAAAISEIAENSTGMDGFHIPHLHWQLTCRHVLTTEWVDGIAIHDIPALKQAGHDLQKLAAQLLEFFLTHALHHGFFHADFHPGNLFVRADGVIVPVDFGIMGRLEEKDRQTMAWILHGLTSGDYLLAAREHIYAGYVPPETNAAVFAQALRAIGEPILNKPAEDISMAELLWQLFETAQKFQMRTQPQLLMLQKTMLATEGIARRLDPKLNIWDIAAPVIENWQQREYAPPAIAQQMAQTAQRLWRQVPAWLDQAEHETQMPPQNSTPPDKSSARKSYISYIFALGGAFLAGWILAMAGFFLKIQLFG